MTGRWQAGAVAAVAVAINSGHDGKSCPMSATCAFLRVFVARPALERKDFG